MFIRWISIYFKNKMDVCDIYVNIISRHLQLDRKCCLLSRTVIQDKANQERDSELSRLTLQSMLRESSINVKECNGILENITRNIINAAHFSVT
jgi:uncharacterized protein with PIN domain